MKEVELVTHKGCPVCVMTEKVLKNKEDICLTVYGDGDQESKLIINESKLRSFPIMKVDGKFYTGNDALKLAKSL